MVITHQIIAIFYSTEDSTVKIAWMECLLSTEDSMKKAHLLIALKYYGWSVCYLLSTGNRIY